MYRVVAALTLVALVNCQAIEEPPKNTVVKVGSDARLNCTVSGDNENIKLTWNELISNPLGALIFRSDMAAPNDPDDYAVEGHYDLIVKSTETQDGGWYSCELTDQDPQPAFLIVVEEPVIIRNAIDLRDGVDANMGCRVRYGAPKASRLEEENLPVLSASIGNRVLVEQKVTTEEGTPGDTPSETSIYFNFTALPEHHGKYVNCTVKTEDPPASFFSSEQLEVMHATSSVQIQNKKKEYQVGEKISCKANGYPAPNYIWKANSTPSSKKTIEGQNLQITESMQGDNNWKCVAHNSEQAEEEEVMASIEFKAVDDSSSGASALMNVHVTLCASLAALRHLL